MRLGIKVFKGREKNILFNGWTTYNFFYLRLLSLVHFFPRHSISNCRWTAGLRPVQGGRGEVGGAVPPHNQPAPPQPHQGHAPRLKQPQAADDRGRFDSG